MTELERKILCAEAPLYSPSSVSPSANSTTVISTKKFKGVKVNCGELRKYLYGVEIYRQASMLRKGREVHKIYVDVLKGVSFLDDRFCLTEFGKMVLENGSVRAGRARNVRQIVVARETLYCSGTGGCKRACGGYGSCVSGCDKIKVRGHKCSFRVKLTMRLGFVDAWFVEILGSHNCYIEDGETPSDMAKMLADYETKSSDGEDSNTSSSQRTSPLPDANAIMALSQNGTHFLPPNSSPSPLPPPPPPPPDSSPLLLAPAHCPLNVPMFPESYLMTVARNAAAAVAMSNSHLQSRDRISPMSLAAIKREQSPPDMIVPEIMNGFFPSPVIPRFGFIPGSSSSPSSSPPTAVENGHRDSTPFVDAMDLSTPKMLKVEEDAPRDLSLNATNKSSPLSFVVKPEAGTRQSPMNHSNGHSSSSKTNNGHVLNGIGNNDNENFRSSHSLENCSAPAGCIDSLKSSIPNSQLPRYSGSPKCVFTAPSASQSPSLTASLTSSSSSSLLISTANTGSSITARSRKIPSKRCKPYQNVLQQNSASLRPSSAGSEGVGGGSKSNGVHSAISGDGFKVCDKDLMNRVQQLEAHVTQLRNIVLKNNSGKTDEHGRRKAQREFDFTKYNTRHVALKVAYLGWDYQGFVVQEDTDKTIEAALFEALLKTRLVESRETSNYHRCGRTDKGVSALGQVISIDLRTNLLKGVGVKVREGGSAHSRQGDNTTEIRYVHILNKVLPPEVRVLAWAPVNAEFSARFSCKKRTYKYYFPKGNLDIQNMREAAMKLVGEHDFRNLCKMDIGNGVVNYRRKILRTEVTVLDEMENGYSMCELTVVGQAFLWHQIRCIVSILFLVAQGKEGVEVIEHLLNVEKNPRKPQYTMASELPLVLFDCDFGDDLEWVYEADWHEDNIRHLQQMWAQHSIRTTMLKKMLDELDVAKVETESDIAPWNELSAPLLQHTEWMVPGNKPRVYKPLFKRQMCESLEERLEAVAKRKKTDNLDTEDTKPPEAMSSIEKLTEKEAAAAVTDLSLKTS